MALLCSVHHRHSKASGAPVRPAVYFINGIRGEGQSEGNIFTQRIFIVGGQRSPKSYGIIMAFLV